MMWCMIVLTLSLATHDALGDQDVRPAVGVAFERKPFILRPMADVHPATFVIKIPDKPLVVDFDVGEIRQHIQKRNFSYMKALRIDESANESNKLNRQIDTRWNELQMLLSTFRAKDLEKRGLFNFVGSLSNTLFGTATEEQVQALASQIKWAKQMVANAAGERTELYEKLSHMTNETDRRITNVIHAVNTSALAIAQLNHNMQRFSKQVVMDMAGMNRQISIIVDNQNARDSMLYVLQKMHFQQMTLSNLKEWIDSLNQLLKGKLTPFLVPIPNLVSALHKLNTWCEKERTNVRPIIANQFLENYYEMGVMISAIVHDTIIVRFPLPLTDPMEHFEIFAVHPFPVPIHQNGNKHVGYTLLSNVEQYLAISTNKRQSAAISQHDIEQCLQKYAGFCPALAVSRTVTDPDCLTAIYFNMPEEIHNRCQFIAYPKAKLPPSIRKLQGNQYLLSNINSPITVVCGNDLTHVKISCYSVVKLHCHCHLRHDKFVTLDSFSECVVGQNWIKINVTHPINYSALKSFNLIHNLPVAVTELQSREIHTLQVPNISKYLETIDQDVAADEDFSMSMQSLAAQTKKHDIAYYPDSSPYIKYSWSPLTTDQYCIIAVAMYSIGLTAWLGVHHHRMLRLATLVATAIPTLTEGTPMVPELHEIISTPATTIPPIPESWKQLDWSLKLIASCFMLSLVVHQLFKITRDSINNTKQLYKYCQWLVSPEDFSQYVHVYIKICSISECAIVYLCSIPFEEDGTRIVRIPTPEHLAIESLYCFPRLCVRMSGAFGFKINGSPLTVHAPTVVYISFSQARRIKRIINSQADVSPAWPEYSPLLYRTHLSPGYRRMHASFLPMRPDGSLSSAVMENIPQLEPQISTLSPIPKSHRPLQRVQFQAQGGARGSAAMSDSPSGSSGEIQPSAPEGSDVNENDPTGKLLQRSCSIQVEEKSATYH